MKKLKNPVFSILLMSIFFTSCHGQAFPKQTQNEKNATTNIAQPPQIVRTKGTSNGGGVVGCELIDHAGNVWFSMGGEGVYRYNGTTFTNFTTKDGLSDNNAGDIIQDKSGNILIATKAGICRYDGKSFSKYFETDSMNNLMITSLFEDKDGNIWFGTMGKGIYRYDGKNLTNFLNNQSFNLGNRYQLILDILQDRNGNLWFSSWNGGGVWRYNGKTFTNFLPSKNYYLSNEDGRTNASPGPGAFNDFQTKIKYPLSRDSITDDMIFSMYEDKAGILWFATRRHGACLFDARLPARAGSDGNAGVGQGKSFTSFSENEAFVSHGIHSIFEDKKGNMWFSTEKNGVYCYDGKTFRNYTTADGLVNNSVFSILEDNDGNLWFGTRWFGLSRFDGKNFTTFSEHKDR
jgi:ligand-binding sensor domain-containing protein